MLGLGALLATSAVYHALLPPAIPEGVVEKLRVFTERKDEFDTLFLGSSRFYYAVSPEIFDRTTGENGVPTRTFNFGVDGMNPPENFYVLEQILKTEPRNLKWIFLELANIETKSHENILSTQRLLYWHDWPRTVLTLKKSLDPDGTAEWYKKLNRLWSSRRSFILHLGLFEKQFTNVGRAADFFSPRTPVPAADSNFLLGPKGDGYRRGGKPMSPERAENFQRRLEQEFATARPAFLDPYAEEAYHDYAARIRRLGAVPILVEPPGFYQSRTLFRKEAPGPVLLFNDHKAYPQLYDAKVRVDDQHLTDEGAAEFTRLLALGLVEAARRS